MKTLYSKPVDLTLVSRSGNRYIDGEHIYFSPTTQDYTRHKIEMKMREIRDHILKKLMEKYKCFVRMHVKEDLVKKINVDKKENGWIHTDSGIIIMRDAIMIEI